MSYEKVAQAKQIIIGTKQTVKALKDEQIKELVVAEDADPHVLDQVLSLAREQAVLVTQVDSMQKLGKACGIDVGAAVAAITV